MLQNEPSVLTFATFRFCAAENELIEVEIVTFEFSAIIGLHSRLRSHGHPRDHGFGRSLRWRVGGRDRRATAHR